MKYRRRIATVIVVWLALLSALSWVDYHANYRDQSAASYQPQYAHSKIFHSPSRAIMRALNGISTDQVMILGTIVIGVFTIVLAWVGHIQNKTTKILQRAYIGVEPAGIKLWSDGSELVAHVFIKNAGNLPASRAKWAIYLQSDADNDRKSFSIDESHVDGSYFIVPQGTVTFGNRYPRIKLQDAIDMRKAGSCYFYVWGRVDYLDGFGVWRETCFCHRYNWGQTRDYDTGEYELTEDKGRPHRYGNYTN